MIGADDLNKLIEAGCDDGWDPSEDGWGLGEFEDENEDPGPLLTATDLSKARAELAEWATPLEFRRLVHKLHQRSRSKEIFNDPKRKFLLDAWVLAALSKHKPFTRLRLGSADEQWPDGYAHTETGELKIEVTSALLPGRRLGAEYKLPGQIEHDPVENWVQRADAIPGALDKAAGDKVKKRYGSPWALVIYLNISEYGIRQAQTEQAFANIKDKYGSEFQQLWILWKDKVF